MITHTAIHIFNCKKDLEIVRDNHVKFLQDYFGIRNIKYNKSRISTEYKDDRLIYDYNRLAMRYFVYKSNEYLMNQCRGYGINSVYFYNIEYDRIDKSMFPLFFGHISTCKYEFITYDME